MRQYLRSRLVQVGLGLLVLGTGPLLFIILAAAVGLWPDPNPNPIGPGLIAEWRNLAMLTYEVDPAILKERVPAGCELDFRFGRTFVSVVGFQFLRTRVLGIPIPFH